MAALALHGLRHAQMAIRICSLIQKLTCLYHKPILCQILVYGLLESTFDFC